MLVVQISTVPGGQGCAAAGPTAATLILPAGSAGMAAVHIVTLLAGRAAYITRGERVSLTNPGSEPASVMVIASPPEFADQLATWPAA